jgi:hypothetical protein
VIKHRFGDAHGRCLSTQKPLFNGKPKAAAFEKDFAIAFGLPLNS